MNQPRTTENQVAEQLPIHYLPEIPGGLYPWRQAGELKVGAIAVLCPRSMTGWAHYAQVGAELRAYRDGQRFRLQVERLLAAADPPSLERVRSYYQIVPRKVVVKILEIAGTRRSTSEAGEAA